MKSCKPTHKTPTREGAYTFMDGEIVYMEDWIMEHKLGRKLQPNERVVHLNGDVFDNRDSNLRVIDSSTQRFPSQG
jgi:hypothetical protein